MWIYSLLSLRFYSKNGRENFFHWIFWFTAFTWSNMSNSGLSREYEKVPKEEGK